MTDKRGEVTPTAATGGTVEVLRVEAFEPSDVRPWKFHNRSMSGLDDASISDLAESIKRTGQQQVGLARRLPAGDTHLVEAIFGVRRLEACRRAGVTWRAEVRDASFSDADRAALMHGENEWAERISPLENAVQWKAMLDAGHSGRGGARFGVRHEFGERARGLVVEWGIEPSGFANAGNRILLEALGRF